MRNPQLIVAVSGLDAGTVTPAIVTDGDSHVATSARSLELTGPNEIELLHSVALLPSTRYAMAALAVADAPLTTGVLELSLVAGVGGPVITDDFGKALTINASLVGLSTWLLVEGSIVTPAQFARTTLSPDPDRVTAHTPASCCNLDYVGLQPMSELYTGGPWAAAWQHQKALAIGDVASVVIANDRAGQVQEWMHRTFDMEARNLQLPSGDTRPFPRVSLARDILTATHKPTTGASE